jgi:hypothetical protein
LLDDQPAIAQDRRHRFLRFVSDETLGGFQTFEQILSHFARQLDNRIRYTAEYVNCYFYRHL